MKTKFAVWCFVFGVIFGNAAIAQTPLTHDQLLKAKSLSQESPPPAWGTSSDSALVLAAAAFTPRAGLALWGSIGDGARFRTSQTIGAAVVTSDIWFDAPVNLPAGAKITGFRANMCDTNATSHVSVGLESIDEPSGDGATLVEYPSPAINTMGTGCISIFADLTGYNIPPFDHETKSYWVRFQLDAPDSTNKLRGAIVYYRLQISPPPGTATFTDVPTTHLFFQYVEALASAGITSGCGGGNFCPDAAVTRGQMAVFLAKALGLHWAP